MRSKQKLVSTVVAVTFGSVFLSLAIGDVIAMLIGFTLDWRYYFVGLISPTLSTLIWVIPLLRANHQLDRMRGKLERLAHIDPLSALPNRRAFFDRARAILGAADEHGWPAAAMMVDVDCFKEINDRHGHDIGDAVIRAVSGALQRTVRANVAPSDSVVARVGGEEFAVLVGHLSESRACALADEICKAVRLLASKSEELMLMVTVSVGIAMRGPGDTIDQVLKIADNAVYTAKGAGRNQWRIGTRGPETASLPLSRVRIPETVSTLLPEIPVEFVVDTCSDDEQEMHPAITKSRAVNG